MKTAVENNRLTIFLENRIDINNAPQIEKEIMDTVEGRSEKIVIDAEKLNYISSAGLRVLMKLSRTIKDGALPIINVSREVYDIFDTTGFTQIFDVKKAMRQISTDGCEEIGSGGYGTVYRLDRETILKVYNHGSLELIENERLMSQRAFLSKLPTAIPYDTVKVGDKYGVVYEMLDSKTAAQIVSADPSKLEETVRIYAAALKEFHTVEIKDELFKEKKILFYELLESIKKYLSDDEYGELKGYLDSIPDRRTFIHGDYNMKNVMIDNGNVMMIDVGDVGVGHPAFDLAGVWLFFLYTPKAHMPEADIKRLMGFDPALGGKGWDIFCKEYFGTEDQEEVARYTDMIKPLALFTVNYHAIRRSAGQPEEVLKKRVDMMVRGLLLPAVRGAAKLDF